MRKLWLGFLSYPPETGSGSGSSDNSAASSSGITSGTASPEMISAAMASESSTGESSTGTAADALARAVGSTADTTEDGIQTDAAISGASGQRPPVETGQAPPNRIEAAVRNARAETTAAVEAKYAWAKNLDQETVRTAFGIAHSLLSDTPKFLRTLAAEEGFELVPIGSRPATGTGTGQPAAATGEFKLPEPRLRSEDGQGAYSDKQLGEILTSFASHLEAKFDGRLKPLLTDRETAQQNEARAAIVREAQTTVTETMTELRAKPFFQVTNKDGQKVDSPKILEYLMAIPQRVRLANPVAAMHRAYATYMEKDILPNYGKISAQQVRDENARKAAGGSGHRPGTGSGVGDTSAKPIQGVGALAKKMEDMYAAASSSQA